MNRNATRTGLYANAAFLCAAFSLLLTASGQSGRNTVDSLRLLLRNTREDTARVSLLNRLASAFVQTNLDSLRVYTEAASNLAHRLRYRPGIAASLRNTCIYHQNRGDYASALRYGLQSLQLYEAEKMIPETGSANLSIAQVYKDMSGQNRTAAYTGQGLRYSHTAYGLYRGVKDTAGMVLSLNVSGILYRDQAIYTKEFRYYDTALALYTKALALIDRSGRGEEHRGKLYNNISQVHSEHRKDYAKALHFLDRAVAFNKARNNQFSLSYNYGNISQAYTDMGRHGQALEAAREMLRMATLVGRPTRIHDSYRQLYRAFEVNRQADSALKYYILADNLDDSLTNLAKTQQVMDLQTRYETGKKELQIQELFAVTGTQNRRILLLAGILAAVGLVAFILVGLYRRVQLQKKQLAFQANQLEVMMKELHHRVKNNLQIVSSLLSLQTYKLEDAETVGVLRESQQRVQAMSLIHQRLYKKDALTTVNVKEYLTDLVESLLSAYGYNRQDFDLQIRIEKELMDIDKALPIGLIVNELVTNAFKYAFPEVREPALLIELKEETGNLHLSVQDNGKGFDEAKWNGKTDSFGKQLITALCRQLRAKQQVDVQEGTRFHLIIPKKAA